MPRSIRGSRFNTNKDIGEDVNPSAYIVNLADCMLVLACGFMVAMISYWNIDVSKATVDELDSAQMQEVDPDAMDNNVSADGTGYVEAGKVYQDPATGVMYLYREGHAADGEESGSDSESLGSSDSGKGGAGDGSSAQGAESGSDKGASGSADEPGSGADGGASGGAATGESGEQ